MTETTINDEQSLTTTTTNAYESGEAATSNRANDFRAQAQKYGEQFQQAADKARVYAGDKFAVASDKFKELQNKDPKELVEGAKEYARQKPGQALLISAAAGLVIGLLLKGGRR